MDPASTTQAGQALINASILGPVLIFAGWLILWLLRRLIGTYEDRVADQKQVVDRIVGVVERHTQTTAAYGEAMGEIATAIASVTTAVERMSKVVDDLHKLILQRGHGGE